MNAEPLPEQLTLKGGRKNSAIAAVIGLPFVAVALLAPADQIHPVARWSIVGFFGLLTLVSLPRVFGWRSELKIDREGFSCVTLFSTWRRSWSDCTEFKPIVVGETTYVGFTNARDERRHQIMAMLSWFSTGSTGMLPDNYNRTTGELADLMNRFRNRALGAKDPT